MNNTGTYVLRDGALVKISNKIPNVATDVSLGGHEEYDDPHLGEMTYPHKNPDGTPDFERPIHKSYHVKSKKDKQRRMKELGLVEKGGKDEIRHGTTNYHDLAVNDKATVFVGRK